MPDVDDEVETRTVIIAYDPTDFSRVGTEQDLPVEEAKRLVREGRARYPRKAGEPEPGPPAWYVRQQRAAGAPPPGLVVPGGRRVKNLQPGEVLAAPDGNDETPSDDTEPAADTAQATAAAAEVSDPEAATQPPRRRTRRAV